VVLLRNGLVGRLILFFSCAFDGELRILCCLNPWQFVSHEGGRASKWLRTEATIHFYAEDISCAVVYSGAEGVATVLEPYRVA
jgi:hypothetical protein